MVCERPHSCQPSSLDRFLENLHALTELAAPFGDEDAAAVGDFNQDGLSDIALSRARASAAIFNEEPPLDIMLNQGVSILLGDINCDGTVNLLDVGPFVEIIVSGQFQVKADINQDGVVGLLDVQPFIDLLL